MDFYKKVVKPKDTTSILVEKECKRAGLQAIINEIIKENNKRRLKEVVDEIHGHLTDLKAIRIDKEPKHAEKCQKLIAQFEECLVKINENNSTELSLLNDQLQRLQNTVEVQIQKNDLDELKKLSEIIQRNVAIIKEIPDVKMARNMEGGGDKYLEIYNKFTNLLNKVLSHLNAHIKVARQDRNQNNLKRPPGQTETAPSIPNKTVFNEVEQKLNQMHRKRLSRLSTFTDQQTNESNFKNFEVLNELPEKETPAPPIKPSPLKREKIPNNGELKAMEKQEVSRRSEENSQSGFGAIFRNSFGKGSVSIHNKIAYTSTAELSQPPSIERNYKPSINRDSIDKSELVKSVAERKIENAKNQELSQPPPVERNYKSSSNRDVIDKSEPVKSLAERQIENAKNQVERPNSQLNRSNSSKGDPSRTPTQIRKIFSSFNCVSNSTNQKSKEDLPNECNSLFEQELKQFQLKNTGLAHRLEDSKFKENEPEKAEPIKYQLKTTGLAKRFEVSEDLEIAPPLPPKNNVIKNPIKVLLPDGKPIVVVKRRMVEPKSEENTPKPLGSLEKSASQSHISVAKDAKQKQLWRNSLDFDSVMIRHNEDVKSVVEDPRCESCSFTTFRSSDDSGKEIAGFDNPIYAVPIITKEATSSKTERQISANLEEELLSPLTIKEITDFDYTTLDFVIDENRKKTRSGSNRFVVLEPFITNLEHAIKTFKGLKRDARYTRLDRLLSKYYVKVDDVSAHNSFDELEKKNLLERLEKAHEDLLFRVTQNNEIMKKIFNEQVQMIGAKYNIVSDIQN